MKVYKLLLLAAVCLALHSSLYSQNHDKDGYYIGLKGDTVSGKFVDYREPAASPSRISFRAAGSANLVNLVPSQCKRISISQSDNYIAYEGKRQTNSVNYQNASTDQGDTFEDISAFLLELFNDGHYHLFQFTDKRRSNFYISEGEGPLQELSYKEYMNNDRVVESPRFRLQLEDFFKPILQNKPDLQAYIDHAGYSSAGLTSLFSKLTAKNNTRARERKYKPQIFVGAGLSVNSLKVTKSQGFEAINVIDEEGDYPSQATPLFDAGVKLFIQRNDGRLFVVLRAAYYNFQHAHNFEDVPSNSHTTTTFKSGAISIPLGMGYKFINTQNISFNVSAGVSPLIFLNNTETKVTNPGPSQTTNVSDGAKGAISLFGEAELEFLNRFSVYGAYYSPVSISNASLYKADHSSLRFGARVRVF